MSEVRRFVTMIDVIWHEGGPCAGDCDPVGGLKASGIKGEGVLR